MNDTRYIPMPDPVLFPVHGDRSSGREIVCAAIACALSTDDAAEKLGEWLGGDCRVDLVDSGKSAIWLGVQALGLRPGDEVIVSTFNCPQVVDALVAAGVQPVLADCDPNTGSLTQAALQGALTARSRAVAITHQFGWLPPETTDVIRTARESGLAVIDDAAQALGAHLEGTPAGRLGDVGVLSFGRTKPFPCMGGGALIRPSGSSPLGLQPASTSSLAVLVDVIRERWRSQLNGCSGRGGRFRTAGPELFSDVSLALSAREQDHISPREMSAVSAHRLARSVRRAEFLINSWRLRVQLFRELVVDLPLEVLPGPDVESIASALVVRVPAELRWPLGEHLATRGIQTSWYHYPLHRQARYRQYGASRYTGADDLWQRVLLLPCRWLDADQVRYVAGSVREFYS